MEFLWFLGSHFTKNSSERKLSCMSQAGYGEESSLWVNFFVEEDHENSK